MIICDEGHCFLVLGFQCTIYLTDTNLKWQHVCLWPWIY
uniref:Uncharacterized protein n=1 Tax=Rhizophora mucronata TaxID=61149 RepID=A0A2P2PS33_RHIMU